MSNLKKLEKARDKAKESVEARRAELDAAIAAHTEAVVTYAVANEAYDQEETLEAARELRAKSR